VTEQERVAAAILEEIYIEISEENLAKAAISAYKAHLEEAGLVVVPKGRITQHAASLDLYERVHGELSEGKKWEDIDNGFLEEAQNWGYESWRAYMQQMLISCLRDIILTYKQAMIEAAEKETTESP